MRKFKSLKVYLSTYYDVSIRLFQNTLKMIFSEQIYLCKSNDRFTGSCKEMFRALLCTLCPDPAWWWRWTLCIMAEQDQEQEITPEMEESIRRGHRCLVLNCRGREPRLSLLHMMAATGYYRLSLSSWESPSVFTVSRVCVERIELGQTHVLLRMIKSQDFSFSDVWYDELYRLIFKYWSSPHTWSISSMIFDLGRFGCVCWGLFCPVPRQVLVCRAVLCCVVLCSVVLNGLYC